MDKYKPVKLKLNHYFTALPYEGTSAALESWCTFHDQTTDHLCKEEYCL